MQTHNVRPKDPFNLKVELAIEHGKGVIKVTRNNGDDELKISLCRTIRVADNFDASNLPPDVGRFPLFSVAEFEETMPQHMVEKGGLFFPMYRE